MSLSLLLLLLLLLLVLPETSLHLLPRFPPTERHW